MIDPVNGFLAFLSSHPLVTVGTMLLLGYLFGRLFGLIGLPEITGFILAGVLVSRHVSGIVTPAMTEDLGIITEVALGLIAFTIGGELRLQKVRRMGRQVGMIVLFQMAVTFLLVFTVLSVLRVEPFFALLLGCLACSTSAATTVAIVHSVRARGAYVDYLFGVVALGDAAVVALFSLIFWLVPPLLGPGPEAGSAVVLLRTVGGILLTIILGVVSGALINAVAQRRSSPGEILIVTLGFFFLSTAASIVFNLSPLLLNMAAGATLANLTLRSDRIFRTLEPLTPPVFALFFVMAGMKVQPAVFLDGSALLYGGAYILFRAAGKYLGSWLGCSAGGVTGPVRRFLGISLFPQADVALGLVLLVQAAPALGHLDPRHAGAIGMVVNIILLSAFVNEVVCPPLARHALLRGNQMEA